jgi:hypothetical protein
MAALGVLIPFYNLYWIFIANVSLCNAINRQLERLGSPKRAPVALAIVTCIFQLVPYVNLVVGPFLWAIHVIFVDRAQSVMEGLLAAESARVRGEPAPVPQQASTQRGLLVGLAAPVGVGAAWCAIMIAVAHKPNSPPPAGADVGTLISIPSGAAGTPAPFSIDETEVTVAAYRLCVQSGPCFEPDRTAMTYGTATCTYAETGHDDLPIDCVTLEEARTFCEWVGKRLPTEKEWEFALRGSGSDDYPWGKDDGSGSRAGCWDKPGPCPVRSYAADRSRFGIYDLVGNLREYTSTPYAPPGEPLSDDFAVKGGSYESYRAETADSRSSTMADLEASTRDGFRCAKDGMVGKTPPAPPPSSTLGSASPTDTPAATAVAMAQPDAGSPGVAGAIVAPVRATTGAAPKCNCVPGDPLCSCLGSSPKASPPAQPPATKGYVTAVPY